MNKINKTLFFAAALFASQSAFGQITSASPYCAAGYDDGVMHVDHHISNVTFGTLNNTTGTTQFAAPHYAYYNTVAAPNLVKGNSYTLSVTHDGGSSIHFVAVYIDFNHNNSFADAGELVLSQTIAASTITNPSTTSVLIPTGAATGTTRMRVMVFEDDEYTWTAGSTVPTPCTADSTGSLDWGETEDYNVNITSATSGAPVAKFGATPLTGTTTTTFNLTDSSTNTPTSWLWSFTPATVTYQAATTNTSTNPKVKFTANGLYAVKLRVSNAAGADSLVKNSYLLVGSTGIEEVKNAGGLIISPNPAKGVFYFDSRNVPDVQSVAIYDLAGRLVSEHQNVSGNSVNIETLSEGSYIVIFKTAGGMLYSRLAVK